ncbi:MAG: ATP-dependent DNA helicase [Sphingobacteriia bacterium]|nr:ATP-dependent DNA helicase [Sphingobacteriia bacterium]
MDFLQELNPAQLEAVTKVNGPTMIIAGAGSGKTRVITYRLAFILEQGLADPFELLALTFTNKAAKEMKNRIEALVGGEARGIWMGTFHSVFSRILRMEAEKIGYTAQFTIYDTDDAISLIKSILKSLNLDDKVYKPRNILNHISRAKNYLIDPTEFEAKYVEDEKDRVTAQVYAIYQERCLKANAMDFDDLLVKPLELFAAHPEVLHKLQHRFKYIVVDEYQDTNHAQYLITRKLAAVHQNICVVGDDSQSIYAFRGANIQNILNFKNDYPEVSYHKLEQNYRSTSVIVTAANSVIAYNQNQLPKEVFTENEFGEKIHLLTGDNEQDESKKVVDAIREQKLMLNLFNKDIAVLYRTNAQSRSIEDALRRSNIPYKIYGGLSFYKRKEIKDILAYLRMAINPQDEEALKRIINYPVRGIGSTSLNRIVAAAGELKVSLWEAILKYPKLRLNKSAESAVYNFIQAIRSFQTQANRENAYEAAAYIAKHSGILKDLHSDESPEGVSRWENVQELLNAIREFTDQPENQNPSLSQFLAEVSLMTDQDDKKKEDQDVVTLMTIHSAKGLEFNAVFVMGMEEELFPSAMSSQTREDIEEERRLFYVAITRARKRLTLSTARMRYQYGNLRMNEPSRFLREIKPDLLHTLAREKERQIIQTIHQSRTTGVPVIPRKSIPTGSEGGDFEGDDLSQLAEGMRVEHPKFGLGTVTRLEGKSEDRKATVSFDRKGEKVLLLRYAKMKLR